MLGGPQATQGVRVITSYHERLYASYKTTHTDHRKGAESAATLQARARQWDGSFAPLLPSSREAIILDGACGNGSLVWWLHQRGYTAAEGVDLAPEQVTVAAELRIPCVRQGDFREVLRSRTNYFDVVVLRDVLEHFEKEAVLDVLDEVRTALRPGGRLLLHVPNAESPFFGRIRYGDFTHETAFTESSLRQVLGAARFVDIEVLPSEVVPQSWLSLLRRAVWRAVAIGYRALVYVEVGAKPAVVTQNMLAVARIPENG